MGWVGVKISSEYRVLLYNSAWWVFKGHCHWVFRKTVVELLSYSPLLISTEDVLIELFLCIFLDPSLL